MKRGFTLIELLIVLAIIGILSVIVVSKIPEEKENFEKEWRICILDENGYEGKCFYANDYEKDGNFILFQDVDGQKELCGQLKIEKNK